ncbi:microcystinase C [Parapedobacter defluvii]|uniref:Microcystinase C n=1 Tax=Parapedobacter defluvii TaxID=2045106 RepID=A0ABQ1L2C2_9SPHI|nr:M81 family metallopeptidase [Parapedobacter defluvii]GGC15463.1 microcystinase C [Parapedobacter defluvii]
MGQRQGKPYRVALLGLYHESNTFIARKTTFEDFQNSHLLRGEEIIAEYRDAYHEIGGMLAVMDREGVEVLPLLFAEATPGGTVTATAYQRLLDEMTTLLAGTLPIDGCLVVPHGAGVSEEQRDMDGHWLGKVRELVGPDVPIVGTIDPHANVSRAMVEATDALIAYRTNPHVDQRDTGRIAGELMIKCLNGTIKPNQCLAKPPVTISIEQQYTAAYPCTLLYEEAAVLMQWPGVLSVSVVLGFPYADVPEMGTSFLVVTDDDRQAGVAVAQRLEALLITHRYAFVGKLETVDAQLAEMYRLEKPILWLDMGDNVGGGSLGDSVVLLKALERDGRLRGFTCIFDPVAVTVLRKYERGAQVKILFGNDYSLGLSHNPYAAKVCILDKVDGKFRETTPRHGGQVQYDMGETVLVETAAGNVVMIHSLRVPPFSLSQLTSFGLDPAGFDVLIAKGVNAPIAAYGTVCHTIMQANTPGVTQADMTTMEFRVRPKPLFPFEDIST